MVYRKANGETGALDYREKAPLASKICFLMKTEIEGKSTASAFASGFRYASRSFRSTQEIGTTHEILAPVIAIAKRGCSY
jgi:gamma-glutamyltranspeptidase/glutathione hydrolase